MFLDKPSEESRRLLEKITISDDVDFLYELFGITPEMSELIEEYYYDAKQGKKRVWRKLEKAIERYPHIPQFKNMLMGYYYASDQEYKARQINQQIVEEHPDYLFGRTAQVNILIRNGKINEALGLIGDEPDISKAFPGRDQFHTDEVAKYYLVWMMYAIAIDDEDKVKLCHDVLEQVDASPEVQENTFALFMSYISKKAQERLQKENEMKVHAEDRSYDVARQTDEDPDFHHPEIESLYLKQIDSISDEELRTVISLPRETLLEDVKTMLADVINRYEYFSILEDEGYLEESDFPAHALFLSAALEDKSLIPYLIDILRQGDELVRFWFGDVVEDLFCTAISRCGKESLDELFSFIKEPNIYYYNKHVAAMSVVLMGIVDSEFEPESKQWLLDVLDFFIEEVENPEIADTDTYTFIANTALYFKESECFAEPVGKLFDLDMIFPGFAGDKTEVLRDLNKTNTRDEFEVYFSGDIVDMYQQANKRWSKLFSKPDRPLFEPVEEIPQGRPVSKERDMYKDVGRNDPCPCGSGKKFKKCCLN